jgi:1-phosphofructokinase
MSAEVRVVILNMNPGFDHWLYVSHRPTLPGVVRADRVTRIVSGKGTNVARALHSLGFADYLCISIVGGSVGALIERDLNEEGIHHVSYEVRDESRVNFSVISEYQENAIQTFNEPGPSLSRDEVGGYTQLVKQVLSRNRGATLVISGSAAAGITGADVAELASWAIDRKHQVLADIAGIWLAPLIACPLSLLKVNREEFMHAFAVDMEDQSEVVALKNSTGIGELIITDGKNGCFGWDSTGGSFMARVTDVAGSVGFTVGCGDSFLAGYIVAREDKMSFPDCLRAASACGVANTLSFGPAMFAQTDVEMGIDHVTVQRCELKTGVVIDPPRPNTTRRGIQR